MEKQQSFIPSETVFTPLISSSGYDSKGLFFFEMEFINGISGTEFLLRSDNDQFFWFVNEIEKQISLSTKNEYVEIEKEVIDKVSEFEEFPTSILEKVDWNVNRGFCHGDLTLENMIIIEDSIFLIDFLDSFVEVPSIDQSKILQDAYFAWSFRDKSDIPFQKLLHLKKKFSNQLHDTLLLIHLFRILPYAEPNTQSMVKKWIEILRNRL